MILATEAQFVSKIIDTVGLNFDSRNKNFVTVRQNCASPKKLSKFSVILETVTLRMV